MVSLNSAIDPKDAHAIDVQYHNACWTTHVTNSLREQNTDNPASNAMQGLASDIEFISMLKETLCERQIISMSNLQTAYVNIRSANCVANPQCSRKKMKDLIESEIPNVEFHQGRIYRGMGHCRISKATA